MTYQLGSWIVDESANLLSRDGEDIRVEKRVMAVLTELTAAKGGVVTKDALIKAVWNGAAVSDHSVATAISDLRRVLGDDSRNPCYIETIPKRGYRLIASVSDCPVTDEQHRDQKVGISGRIFTTALATSVAVATALFFWLASLQNEAPRLFLANIENATEDPAWTLEGDVGAEMLTVALAGGDYRLVRWRATDLSNPTNIDKLELNKNDRLLRGRIIIDGDEPILSLQLVDVSDGVSIWANVYELGAEKFGALSIAIATDLKIPLGIAASPQEFSGADAAMLEAYWRARYLWSLREHDAIRNALRILTDLTQTAPDFAPAHAALADIYAHKSAEELGIDRVATYPIAERHLARAMALDPALGEAFVTSAYLRFFKDRDVPAAIEEIDKAIMLRPENAVAWQTRAMIANASGNIKESIVAIDKARDLDPLSASMLWDKVWFHYIGEDYDTALSTAAKARSISAPVVIYEALINTARGDYDAALASWLDRAKARGLSGPEIESITAIAQVDGAFAALGLLAERALSESAYSESPIPLAALLIAVKRNDIAVGVLDAAAVRERSWFWSWYDVMPVFDDIRENQALANLTQRKITDPNL